MKRLTVLFLVAALLTTCAAALASHVSPEDAAKAVVPSNAQFLHTSRDDGLTECHFETPDGMRYEVEVDPASGTVVHMEIKARSQRGGSAVSLTEEQARNALLKLYPDAEITVVHQERDDGAYGYELHFRTPDLIGRAEINAETGELLEAELDYTTAAQLGSQGPLSADQARALALSLLNGSRITEFETERENGRTVYEGELRSDSGSYEFVIDAETGAILQWEKD